jgi:hypothetical protein
MDTLIRLEIYSKYLSGPFGTRDYKFAFVVLHLYSAEQPAHAHGKANSSNNFESQHSKGQSLF